MGKPITVAKTPVSHEDQQVIKRDKKEEMKER